MQYPAHLQCGLTLLSLMLHDRSQCFLCPYLKAATLGSKEAIRLRLCERSVRTFSHSAYNDETNVNSNIGFCCSSKRWFLPSSASSRMTLDLATVDLGPREWSGGLLYVALSRLKIIEGLLIKANDEATYLEKRWTWLLTCLLPNRKRKPVWEICKFIGLSNNRSRWTYIV